MGKAQADRTGEIGELAFALHAVENGIQVAFPHGHDHQFDFVVYFNGRASRVQVKATTHMRRGRYEVCTHRKTKPHQEVDYYACYIVPERMFYIVPVKHVPAGSGSMELGKKYDRFRNAWHLLKGKAA